MRTTVRTLEAPRVASAGGPAGLLPEDPLATGDAAEAAQLRTVLDRAGLTPAALKEAYAADDAARVVAPATALPVGCDPRLETLLRLFHLGEAVPERAARRALDPFPLGRLAALGLLEDHGGEVAASVSLINYDGLYFASDFHRPGPALPPNVVMPVSFSSIALDYFTVRRPARRALDVGTGCGVQALLAARHARRVVATDVNRRALNLAGFNVWLNGLVNVELREGSLFEPVEGERFELVVSNPPFVVSPETSIMYRDGGRAKDALCEEVVRSVPRFLTEGGFGHVLCNWLLRPGEEELAPPRRWLEGSGCAAIVLHHRTYDPREYAERWAGGDGDSGVPARWIAYYRALGVAGIGSGAVIARRGVPSWAVSYPTPAADIGRSGDQLAGLFALHDELYALGEPERLLDLRLVPAGGHVLEPAYEAVDGRYVLRGGLVRVLDGLAFRTSVDPGGVELLARLDGRRTPREVADGLAAASGDDPATTARACLPLVQALVTMGVLVPAGHLGG